MLCQNYTTPPTLSDRLSSSLHIIYLSICIFYLSDILEFLLCHNFSNDGYVNSDCILKLCALMR